LDTEKTGQLTIQALKKRLTTLFPEMTAKEFRFLMNNKKEITAEDLKELLLENELTQFDPINDAFKVFDPDNKGVINEDKLRQAFISFGYGELSDEELEVLKRVRFSYLSFFLFYSSLFFPVC
jgi:calmodulin